MLLNDLPSDESDSDYEPDQKEDEKQEKAESRDLDKAKAELEQIKQEVSTQKIEKPKENSLEEALKIAQKIKESESAPQMQTIKAKFAGENLGVLPIKRGRASLDQLASELTKKKSITSVSKSKLDWEKYKEQNNLEDDLAKNRKDGYLGKKDFLDLAKEREKSRLSEMKRKRYNDN
ncbi:unnamed protein product [Blepharisma stoltei]|uniref:BCNT-C domain-containing protein n=1 Tax=Blepharisma stoltei TaxID=1481888 RepID=A0AAU9JAH0_9CILI|nr:unnamed protein product [Blepharisma stoltei]